MIHNPLQGAMQAAARMGLNVPTPDQRPTLEEAGGLAAESVEVDWVQEEEHFPGDRMPRDVWMPEISDEATADITEAVQRELEEWGGGSYTHTCPRGDVRVMVSEPNVYVTDADGKVVKGGRVMVAYARMEYEPA